MPCKKPITVHPAYHPYRRLLSPITAYPSEGLPLPQERIQKIKNIMSKLSSDHPTTGTSPVTQTQEAASHDIPSGDSLLQRGGGRLIFSAPSGSGKSTIVQWLMREHPELRLAFSISCTTRAPRGTEQNGVEDIFLSPEAFKEKIKNGEFLEYEEVYENRFYGTLKSPPSIEELRRRLVGRQTDSAEAIENRLAKASYELTFADKFDRIIVNDNLEKAEQEAYEIVKEFIER